MAKGQGWNGGLMGWKHGPVRCARSKAGEYLAHGQTAQSFMKAAWGE